MIRVSRKAIETCEEQRVLVPEGMTLVQILDAQPEADGEELHITYLTAGGGSSGIRGVEKFYLTPAAQPRLAVILKRLGLQERGDSSDDLFGDFDEAELIGQRLVVEVYHENYTNKKGEPAVISKWTWGKTWNVEHKEVKQFIDSLRRRTVPAQNGVGGGGAPATQQQSVNRPAPVAVPQDDEV